MPMPPKSPLKNDKGVEINYFQKLAELVKPYLLKEGIKLDFTGYGQTLLDYQSLEDSDINKARRLAVELNSWSEYVSSLANLIQKLYLDSETEKNEKISSVSCSCDAKSVSNGDRLANKNPGVVEARKKRNILKPLYEELNNKVEFLNRAYYHCKQTIEWESKVREVNNITNR